MYTSVVGHASGEGVGGPRQPSDTATAADPEPAAEDEFAHVDSDDATLIRILTAPPEPSPIEGGRRCRRDLAASEASHEPRHVAAPHANRQMS
jgi:hypothetical protein